MTTFSETVTAVLNSHAADDGKRISFPLDTVELAVALGAEVWYSKRSLANRLLKFEDSTQIYLYKKSSEEENRIICAEAVITMLTQGAGMYLQEFAPADGTSQEALELVMPAQAVRKFWGDGVSIRKLSKIFGVSKVLVERRLISLRLY